MSKLVRFSTGDGQTKARIFEQGSQRKNCAVCNEFRFPVLVRFVEPKKFESGVCHECIVRLARGEILQKDPEVAKVKLALKKKTLLLNAANARFKKLKSSLESKEGQRNEPE